MRLAFAYHFEKLSLRVTFLTAPLFLKALSSVKTAEGFFLRGEMFFLSFFIKKKLRIVAIHTVAANENKAHVRHHAVADTIVGEFDLGAQINVFIL